MRLTEYSFVFDDWQPDYFRIVACGYSPCIFLGLPYVEFHLVTSEFAVSVRCDPCSCVEEMAGYALMVRDDLEKAVFKERRRDNA